eukprot:1334306-Alexandrium_andersonii.AAC.1
MGAGVAIALVVRVFGVDNHGADNRLQVVERALAGDVPAARFCQHTPQQLASVETFVQTIRLHHVGGVPHSLQPVGTPVPQHHLAHTDGEDLGVRKEHH